MEDRNIQTLTEATEGRKLRALPPRLGVGHGPWKPQAWTLEGAEKHYVNSWSTWRRAWNKQNHAETFANAHAMRQKHLREALLAYTDDAAFVARAVGEAWQFADANDYALERAENDRNRRAS